MDVSRVVDAVGLGRRMEAKVAAFEQQSHRDVAARARASAQVQEQASVERCRRTRPCPAGDGRGASGLAGPAGPVRGR
eukprot:4208101-Pyramimonas_sp.AAC.1